MPESVGVNLSKDEALVIEDALFELDESDNRGVFDEAQWTAIWRLMGQLEKSLAEPFRDNYAELLSAAKRRITSSQDE